MSQQPVNVTVVHRGCGSGCATLLLILLAFGFALALVAQFFEYWYITVPIAVAVVALALVNQNAAKKKTAATQGKAQVIDSTATISTQGKPPSASLPALKSPIPAAPACTCGYLSPGGTRTPNASCPVHRYPSKTASQPIPAQPAVPALEPRPSEGQANGHDSASEQSPTFIADELAQLAQLRDSGVLTEEEFADAKRWLLGKGPE